ncbi:MAG: cation:proton antiporter subunit C [Akkermansiaceae bacterium]|nr:cation:proton antiporter subunit C [Akkermansiaceae bacterium]
MPTPFQILLHNFNYVCYVVLLMIGLHAMITKRNLIKKLIGMSVFSTAIILFYVSIGVNNGGDMLAGHDGRPVGNIPVLEHGIGHDAITHPETIDPRRYANPLPHVLMLTAIVVGVATLGVALAITQRVFQDYGTLEEDEILAQLNNPQENDD